MQWLLNLFSGGLLTSVMSWLNKREDVAAVQSTNAATATGALVQADIAHTNAIRDVTTQMFSHPVFWVAWAFGVFPVLLYHACIYFVSTFPMLGWTVLKVPHDELEFGQMVIGSVFTFTGASSVVAGLAHAWIRRA